MIYNHFCRPQGGREKDAMAQAGDINPVTPYGYGVYGMLIVWGILEGLFLGNSMEWQSPENNMESNRHSGAIKTGDSGILKQWIGSIGGIIG